MTIRKSLMALLAGAIALPVLALAPLEAHAQFVSQQQIIQKLRIDNNGGGGNKQFRRKQNFQQQGNVQHQGNFQGQVVVKKKRAPQGNNGNGGPVATFRAPQGNGEVVFRRAPQGNNGNGGAVATLRAPQGNGGEVVIKRRAPQGNNGDGEVAFRRAPAGNNGGGEVVIKRAPKGGSTELASNGGGADETVIRGIRIDETSETTQVIERTEVAAADQQNGRIDLEILFDYDSDRIRPESVQQLIALADALNDPSLGKGAFMIAGHTDSAGSRDYNNDLSYRRAQAVSEFLIRYAGVDGRRLVTEGYGEDYLKFPDAPESGQNRRVEIINLGEAS